MFTILKKIFIKNYDNTNLETVRNKYGVLASVFGCIINFILFIIKLLVGILSNSISIIGDAINNLTDMGSSIISFFGFKISSKPADKEHPFGHQRVEYITSLIVSIIIIVVGIELFSNSIEKIINKSEVTYSILTIVILVISILIKLYLALVNKNIGKKINSLTLKATSRDSLNDCIATFFILISTILSLLFNINIDGYIGILVSLFIIYSGISLVKETISPLIGEKVDVDLINNVLNLVYEKKEILGVHDVIAHSYGPTKIFMSLHAEVDSKSDILKIHDVIDNIEFAVKDKYNVSLVIHMDPIVLDCDITNEYKEKIANHLQTIDTKLSFHDFRCVIADNHINIIFDIVKNKECKMSEEEIKKSVNDLLIDNKVKINLIISFDEEFSTSF